MKITLELNPAQIMDLPQGVQDQVFYIVQRQGERMEARAVRQVQAARQNLQDVLAVREMATARAEQERRNVDHSLEEAAHNRPSWVG